MINSHSWLRKQMIAFDAFNKFAFAVISLASSATYPRFTVPHVIVARRISDILSPEKKTVVHPLPGVMLLLSGQVTVKTVPSNLPHAGQDKAQLQGISYRKLAGQHAPGLKYSNNAPLCRHQVESLNLRDGILKLKP
jgi:hypothetical protein